MPHGDNWPITALFRRDGLKIGFGQKLFHVQRGHAAHARGGHGLAIDLVADVAGGEHARNGGPVVPFSTSR